MAQNNPEIFGNNNEKTPKVEKLTNLPDTIDTKLRELDLKTIETQEGTAVEKEGTPPFDVEAYVDGVETNDSDIKETFEKTENEKTSFSSFKGILGSALLPLAPFFKSLKEMNIPFISDLFGGILDWIKKGQIDQAKDKAKEFAEKIDDNFIKKFEYFNILIPEEKELFIKVMKDEDTFTEEQKNDLLKGKMNLKEAYEIAIKKSHNKEKFGEIPLPTTKELIEARLETTTKKLKDSLFKYIQREYNVTFNSEKRGEANKIFDETFKDPQTKKRLIENYNDFNTDYLSTTDGINSIIDLITKPGIFIIKLALAGVIEVSDLAMQGVEVGSDFYEISFGKIDIKTYISQNQMFDLIESENFSPEELAMYYGILYRKTGLYSKILGNSFAAIGNTAVGHIGVRDAAKGLSGYKGPIRDIEFFEKLESSLFNKMGINQADSFVTESKNILKQVKIGYLTIALKEGELGDLADKNTLKKFNEELAKLNGGNTKFAYATVEDAISASPKGIKNTFSASKLSPFKLGNKIGLKETYDIINGGDIREFRREAQKLIDIQNSVLNDEKALSIWKQIRAWGTKGKLFRHGDKIGFNANNIDDLRAYSQMAKEAPELMGNMIGKAAVIGLGAELMIGDKPNFELIQLAFAFRGPRILLEQSGFGKEGGIQNKTAFVFGAGLMALDTGLAAKAMVEGASNGGRYLGAVKGLGKYIATPIVDTYDLGRGALRFTRLTGEATINTGKTIVRYGTRAGIEEFMIHLGKLPKFKDIFSKINKNKGKSALFSALMLGPAAAAYAGEYFDDEEIKYLRDIGAINADSSFNDDADFEKFKLTNEEKELLIEGIVLVNSGVNEGIGMKLEGSDLYIISENPNVQSDEFIDGLMLERLAKLGVNSDTVRFYYQPKEEEKEA